MKFRISYSLHNSDILFLRYYILYKLFIINNYLLFNIIIYFIVIILILNLLKYIKFLDVICILFFYFIFYVISLI